MTRKQKVLQELIDAKKGNTEYFFGINVVNLFIPSGWVPRHILCSPSIGGAEGTKRLRELKQGGIEYEWRYYFVPDSNGDYVKSVIIGHYVKVKNGEGNYRKTDTTIYRLITPLDLIDVENCKLRRLRMGSNQFLKNKLKEMRCLV